MMPTSCGRAGGEATGIEISFGVIPPVAHTGPVTAPPAAPAYRPYSLAGRVVRIALGAVALVGGAAGALLAVAFLARAFTDASLALAPWKALVAAVLVLAFTALFAALGTMGWRRVVAGIRGHAAAAATSQDADALRFLVSARTRRFLAAFVVGMLVCALTLAGLGGAATWLALIVLGAAVASGAVLVAARTPEHSCSFCGASRAKATWLVAGQGASICDLCIQAALGEFAKYFASRGETSEWCNRFLRALPSQCPRAISRPFIERVAGQQRTAAGIRNAVWWCFKLGNEPFARHLLELLPEPERQPEDWLNLGVALGEEGRFADALEATERALVSGDEHRPWVLNNSAWFRSRLHPDARTDERAAWLRDVEEAERLMGARRQADRDRVVSASLRGTEAELRRLSGDLEGAMQVLERAEAEQPLTGAQMLIRAHALTALGRHAEGKESLERALSLLHPEERMADEARQLLTTLAP